MILAAKQRIYSKVNNSLQQQGTTLQPPFMQVAAICKVHWRGNILDIWDGEGGGVKLLFEDYTGDAMDASRGQSQHKESGRS